jgi:hypothetical protein
LCDSPEPERISIPVIPASELNQDNSRPDSPEPGGIPIPGIPDPELDQLPDVVPVLADIIIASKFVELLKTASLDNEVKELSPAVLHQIRHPAEEVLTVEDPDHRLSIDVYLSVTNASEETYNSTRTAILRRYPDSGMLTYHGVKQLITQLTGIVPIIQDMCINSCLGYTGPFSELDCCSECGESRYDPTGKVSRKQFHTYPIAPQLQALWRTPEGAYNMGYRARYTEKILSELQQHNGNRISPYGDFFDGVDYLTAVQEGRITSDDMVLMLSIDGAQLYRNKISECWIWIWIIFDNAPNLRYKKKHILPGGIIPGKNKPKNSDSFLYPGLHHIAAIQKEGLLVWDARRDLVFKSHVFLALATADGPGMTYLNGCVGHSGKSGCRLYCPLIGRHKPGGTHYYPARFKPAEFDVLGCSHDDVDLESLLSGLSSAECSKRYNTNLQYVSVAKNKSQFDKRRLETGICKPSIFSGLPSKHILGIPGCFPLDIMHLPALNLPDLFLPLWRGTFECDKTDNKNLWEWSVLSDKDTWKAHGQMVADATPYIPGSFDRPPRNPAEKISSGYKAWEFLLYFYGLGPALFHGILPQVYWKHYCKLVRGFRILLQEEITSEELLEAHLLLSEFSDDFEHLYVQRRTDRIHFVRPGIHTLSHFAPETVRIGPNVIFSQWSMERTIGNLGEEIKQHSSPFANLAQRGLRRCRINALKALIPDLEPPDNPYPRGSIDQGNGYILLRKRDNAPRPVKPCELDAIRKYKESMGEQVPDDWTINAVRWARLRLPNGQIARSAWKEKESHLENLRISRNVKVRNSN